MKLNPFLFLIIAGLFISCGSKPADPIKSEPTEAPKEEPKNESVEKEENISECYRYIGNRDTINLRISETYNIMTGLLIYKNYQKDQNLGTLQGKMTGDVLIADYTFRSEGITSTRQVAFKKQGNDLVEGYGDVVEANGKMVFKDVHALKYDDSRVLKNVPCKQ